ncbi:MAG: hypothetical protein ABEJ83_00060 [Candidatus Nanohaloarchaea archaeon]
MGVRLKNLLEESLVLLLRQPKLFVPKLISSFLGSAYVIFLFERFLLPSLKTGVPSSSLTVLAAILGASLVLTFVGFAAPVMVASMVKNSYGLKKSFLDTLRLFFQLVKASMLFYLLIIFISLPAVLGVFLALKGFLSALLPGLAISLILILLVTFAAYFFPITLLNEEKVGEGLKESWGAAQKRSNSVGVLTLFSLMMLLFVGVLSSELRYLGYAGFLAGRILSTVINTYVFVISPRFYLES